MGFVARFRGAGPAHPRLRDAPGRAALLGLEPSRGRPGRLDQPRDRAAAYAGVASEHAAPVRVADAGARLLSVHASLERAAARPAARRARQLRFGDTRGHPRPGVRGADLLRHPLRRPGDARVLRGRPGRPGRGRLGGRGDRPPDRAAAHGHHLAVRAGGGLSLPAGQRQRGLQRHRRVRRPDAVDRRVRHRQPGGERPDAHVHARAAAGRVRADRRDRGHGDRGGIPEHPDRDPASRADQHSQRGDSLQRHPQLFATRAGGRRAGRDQGDDRLRHAVAAGAGDAADGRRRATASWRRIRRPRCCRPRCRTSMSSTRCSSRCPTPRCGTRRSAS